MFLINKSKTFTVAWNEFNNCKYGIVRSLNTSFSLNNNIESSKLVAKCPMSDKYSSKDSIELHCSLEEWENAKPFKDIPGPKALPIIGNTWRFIPGLGEYDFSKTYVIDMFKKMHLEFGKVVRLEKIFGLDDAMHVYDPVDIEKVYKVEGVAPQRDIFPSMSYYRKHMRQDLFKDAKGLLTSQGEDWYVFRNKVNSIMMQPKMVKQYIQPIDSIGKEFVERIKSIRCQDNKISLDFEKEVNKWALESITYLAMNTKLGCLQGDLPENSVPARMIRIVEDVFTYSAKLDFEPSIWKYISTPTYRKTMKIYNEQTSISEELIKEAIKDINKRKDRSDENLSEPSVLEKLLKIDEKVAVVMALDMLLAGVDTTSTAFMNILYYLSTNKSKQDILKKEILKQLPEKNSILTAETLNSLPYLKACIKEAARLYPVAPGTMRTLTKGMVLSGYQVPKGTIVAFPHMYLSMDEKQFPQPDKFIPERWLRDNTDMEFSYKKAHPFSSMQFGFGSRSCIGRRFAELELEVAITNIMRNLDVSWEGPPPRRFLTGLNYLSGPFNFIFADNKS